LNFSIFYKYYNCYNIAYKLIRSSIILDITRRTYFIQKGKMKREEETNMEMTENRQFNSIDNRNLRTNEIDEFYEGTADTRDAQNMDK